MMRASLIAPTLFLALAQYSVPISRAQERSRLQTIEQSAPNDVLRISTTLVTVPVSVKDRHGTTVQDLRREDFHLYEDGVEQEIAYFESPENAKNGSKDARSESAEKPLTLVLLLDNSDSTQFKLKEIKDAAIAFVDQLGPEDRILVMAFDRNVRVLIQQTMDRNTLRDAISRMQSGGGTSLYDALDSVIAWLARISGRKAIVLLTDGVDTASVKATYESTVRAAEQLDAAVYSIQYNTYADFADNPSRQTSAVGMGGTAHMTRSGELASEAYKRGTLYLRLLAVKTGGRFEYADSIKTLSRSFGRIAAELRQQYTLGYYPKNKIADGGQRQINVHVGLPKVTVHARKGYIYRQPAR